MVGDEMERVERSVMAGDERERVEWIEENSNWKYGSYEREENRKRGAKMARML